MITLLPSTTITTAVTGSTSDTIYIGPDVVMGNFIANFDYGSGGTNATFYVQTSNDGGTTWDDLVCWQFTTSDAVTVSMVNATQDASHNPAAVQDAALTANTVNADAVIGDLMRVKYTTTGTYAGGTTIKINAVLKTFSGKQAHVIKTS